MFKLFKTKSQPSVVTESVDQKIYKDVYSAQELLLEEANTILSKPTQYDEARHARLLQMNKLGFSSAAEVREFNEICDKIKKQENIKSKIEYYQQHYPLNKFINEDSVKTICEKYNLLLTEASDYIAEIPEKNQNEIIAFRVKRKDKRFPHEVYRGMWAVPSMLHDYSCAPMSTEERKVFQNEKIVGQNLLIIAPEHKLNTHGKIKDGHVLKIKDPIVLQPVEGGYLIVSSWGLEASDTIVMNPVNN